MIQPCDTVRWMPSHLEEADSSKVRPADVSDLDIDGNSHADKLAGQAAELVLLPNAVAVPIMIIIQRLYHVQKRLATILLFLPDRQTYKKRKNNVYRALTITIY